MTLCNNAGVQNAQTRQMEQFVRTANVASVPINSITSQIIAPNIDLTQAQTLSFTFNVANTDQVTPNFWLVELIQ